MTKRKRNRGDADGEADANMDEPDLRAGMGGALKQVKGVRSADISNTITEGDDDGWTVVSGNKKHKKVRKLSNGDKDETLLDQKPQITAQEEKQKAKSKPANDGYPSFKLASSARLDRQVRLSDFQNLVLYALGGGASAPTFLAVQNAKKITKVVVLMVPGLDRSMFAQQGEHAEMASTATGIASHPDDYFPMRLEAAHLPENVKPVADVFTHLWPTLSPADYKTYRLFSPMAEMLNVSISRENKSRQDMSRSKERFKRDQRKVSNSETDAKKPDGPPVPIQDLVASLQQLEDDGYVLHPAVASSDAQREALLKDRKDRKRKADDGWMDSTVIEASAETAPDLDNVLPDGYRVLALDCEMCKTSEQDYDLARISVVDYDGKVVLDELCKPDKPIVDYVTHYSGITKETLDRVETRLPHIQKRVLDLLTPKTILIGHSLNSDFDALKMTHPLIIDTSIIYPHPRGPPFKSSLKFLADKRLGRSIQTGNTGHDPIEDARAALDLVKLKVKRGHAYGTIESSTESIFTRVSRQSVPSGSDRQSMKGAIVDWGFPQRGYGRAASVTIDCENDDDVVKGISRAVNGDEDGSVVPGGGVALTWARFRELDALRGLWNRSSSIDNDDLRKRVRTQYLSDSESNAKDAESQEPDDADATGENLSAAVSRATQRIKSVYDSLPPCTALVVYSGNSDARELYKMSEQYRTFKKEYEHKKWDELSVRWTDAEEQARDKAFKRARQSVAFATVK